MITLRVDGAAWRAHQRRVVAATPGLVPVAKGGGYGFGLATLAAEAQALGVGTLAVGTASEVRYVRGAFAGDVVVLQPWRPDDRDAVALLGDERIVHTVSRVSDLAAVAGSGERPRVLLEVLTSMRRFGIAADTFADVAPHLASVELAGWTLHLPMPSAWPAPRWPSGRHRSGSRTSPRPTTTGCGRRCSPRRANAWAPSCGSGERRSAR